MLRIWSGYVLWDCEGADLPYTGDPLKMWIPPSLRINLESPPKRGSPKIVVTWVEYNDYSQHPNLPAERAERERFKPGTCSWQASALNGPHPGNNKNFLIHSQDRSLS